MLTGNANDFIVFGLNDQTLVAHFQFRLKKLRHVVPFAMMLKGPFKYHIILASVHYDLLFQVNIIIIYYWSN